MKKLIRNVVAAVSAVAGLGLATAALGIVVARASLPASSCVVSEAQVDKLKLEMRYIDVRAILGCEGYGRRWSTMAVNCASKS